MLAAPRQHDDVAGIGAHKQTEARKVATSLSECAPWGVADLAGFLCMKCGRRRDECCSDNIARAPERPRSCDGARWHLVMVRLNRR